MLPKIEHKICIQVLTVPYRPELSAHRFKGPITTDNHYLAVFRESNWIYIYTHYFLFSVFTFISSHGLKYYLLSEFHFSMELWIILWLNVSFCCLIHSQLYLLKFISFTSISTVFNFITSYGLKCYLTSKIPISMELWVIFWLNLSI